MRFLRKKDELSKERLNQINNELVKLHKEDTKYSKEWQHELTDLDTLNNVKKELDTARFNLTVAFNEG